MMRSEEVCSSVDSSFSDDADCCSVARATVERALALGSMDNCTALVVRLSPADPSPSERSLLDGDLRKATSQATRESYAKFFEQCGFPDKASDVRNHDENNQEESYAVKQPPRGWSAPGVDADAPYTSIISESDFPALLRPDALKQGPRR